MKEDVYPLIAVKAPAEVMVKCVAEYHEVLEQKHDCLGIDPGLGHANEAEVLDADALNMLARTGLAALHERRAPSLLTPHPGEMARLVEALPMPHAWARGCQAARRRWRLRPVRRQRRRWRPVMFCCIWWRRLGR